MRREKDGTLTPWQLMSVCAAADGTVYVETIAPFTLLRYKPGKRTRGYTGSSRRSSSSSSG
jgi:hypothetical protein